MKQFLFFTGLITIIILFVLSLVADNEVDAKLFSALCLVVGSVTGGQLDTSENHK